MFDQILYALALFVFGFGFAAICFALSIRRRKVDEIPDQIIMIDLHAGEVTDKSDGFVTVVYSTSDDLVRQTYADHQFLRQESVPNKGDLILTSINMAVFPRDEEQNTARIGTLRERKNTIEGPDEF